MIGFVLAAGFGTRLRPLTDNIPKALVTVCGKPLLARSMDFFLKSGVERIAVNAHHHAEKIEDFLGKAAIECAFFHEADRIRGTGGAFYFARDFLAEDEVFCAANVDIVAQIDLDALRREFLALDCEAGLVAVPSASGTVWYRKDDGEYIGARSEDADAVRKNGGETLEAEFIGIAFYKRATLSLLSPEDFSVLPVWQRMRKAGMSVKVLNAGRVYWNDCGTPAKLAQIHFDVLDGVCRLDVPEDIVVDAAAKKAYPRSLDREGSAALGRYSWVETTDIPDSTGLERVVAFRDARIAPRAAFQNAIITRYGVIPFEA